MVVWVVCSVDCDVSLLGRLVITETIVNGVFTDYEKAKETYDSIPEEYYPCIERCVIDN